MIEEFINQNEAKVRMFTDHLLNSYLVELSFLALAVSLVVSWWLFKNQKKHGKTWRKILFLLSALLSMYLLGLCIWVLLWVFTVDSFGF